MAHLVTGFPGFVSRFFIEELSRHIDDKIVVLVEPRFVEKANRILSEQSWGERCEVVSGDITDPKLGFTSSVHESLVSTVTHVWHLAAIYDLTVDESLAYKVNVMGTVHILDFCEACANFERLNYVSTCYVAGKRSGTVFEDELDEGQSHFNHYESTKFWAEMEVKRRETVPSCVLRPAIIVGHSKTGETDKYDGPYYLFKMLKKLPSWVPIPNLGDASANVNMVPIDYAVRALTVLGLADEALGRTFHVADPNPMTPPEIVDLSLEFLNKNRSVGSMSPKLLNMATQNSRIERWLGMPKEVVEYFQQRASFDTTSSREILFEHDVVCPHLSHYLQVIIDYFENNPDHA